MVELSPNFMERMRLLLEKEQDKRTIGQFFELCLVEFDNPQDIRFIKWFRLGFVGRSKEIVYADPMIVVLEHTIPRYLAFQNETI